MVIDTKNTVKEKIAKLQNNYKLGRIIKIMTTFDIRLLVYWLLPLDDCFQYL